MSRVKKTGRMLRMIELSLMKLRGSPKSISVSILSSSSVDFTLNTNTNNSGFNMKVFLWAAHISILKVTKYYPLFLKSSYLFMQLKNQNTAWMNALTSFKEFSLILFGSLGTNSDGQTAKLTTMQTSKALSPMLADSHLLYEPDTVFARI